jgi:ArsR family metal-binding transcriptional regulator
MTDAIFLDAEEKLMVILERNPSYEEVLDYLNYIYKENNYERKRYNSTNSKRYCLGNHI